VAREPLIPGKREAPRAYADKVIGQDLTEERSVSSQLRRGPVFAEGHHYLCLILHFISSHLVG
jgi:hypothetical protein